MNAEEFVGGVHAAAYRNAISGVLKQLANPAGRRPRKDVVELSKWFNQLTGEGRERVEGTVRRAVYQAIFDMLAVLDGVSAIDEDHTDLYLRTGDGTLLNEHHDLHELFQISVDHELGYVDEQGYPIG
jgi:hypothetical protein